MKPLHVGHLPRMWKECWLDLYSFRHRHHLMHWPHMPNQDMWKETSFYQFHHQHHLMALDGAGTT